MQLYGFGSGSIELEMWRYAVKCDALTLLLFPILSGQVTLYSVILGPDLIFFQIKYLDAA